jgi:hypothetical protein
MTLKKLLAWAFLALVALGSCALLERGDGELERYGYEDVR